MEDVVKLILDDEMFCGLYNNCFGKYVGFLGLVKIMGVVIKGYIELDYLV